MEVRQSVSSKMTFYITKSEAVAKTQSKKGKRRINEVYEHQSIIGSSDVLTAALIEAGTI